ncbi:hypothetical protein OG857_26560 [Streptomyces cyaneofuscatus]|uniref:hypothetical protein n=1 Tax=Streptomyces cyaneofuscatus TaxID=66883 RepID=UPI002DDB2AE7|nr:hypothetical protein [Streptomyces cyaneofuscatus]WSD49117.1 hypothetical protein OG857_26560 [Streptomyces cyaneofuscatus]
MSAALAVALLGGLAGQAAADERSHANSSAARARLLSALAQLPPPAAPPAPPARTALDRLSADQDRQLVEGFAEFDDEEEVREAARKALESTDPQTIREFLERGEAEARKHAKDKRDGTDVANRQKIEALRGTGGTHFNAEVERVLKGTARDRADFLAFGAEIARQRDRATEQNEQQRAAENRRRVEMLVAVGGPEVKRTAAEALATGDGRAITRYLEKGYLLAAQQDADDRAAHEKAQMEALEAAERLRKLAENAARAAGARTKLIAAHGDAVKALKTASNAMNASAAGAREADRMLSADRAGKSLSDYGPVKAEVVRQLGIAEEASRQSQVAAARAKVQADVLVETGLPHGTQWSDVAAGIAAAAEAAFKAASTARHAGGEGRRRRRQAGRLRRGARQVGGGGGQERRIPRPGGGRGGEAGRGVPARAGAQGARRGRPDQGEERRYAARPGGRGAQGAGSGGHHRRAVRGGSRPRGRGPSRLPAGERRRTPRRDGRRGHHRVCRGPGHPDLSVGDRHGAADRQGSQDRRKHSEDQQGDLGHRRVPRKVGQGAEAGRQERGDPRRGVEEASGLCDGQEEEKLFCGAEFGADIGTGSGRRVPGVRQGGRRP